MKLKTAEAPQGFAAILARALRPKSLRDHCRILDGSIDKS